MELINPNFEDDVTFTSLLKRFNLKMGTFMVLFQVGIKTGVEIPKSSGIAKKSSPL